MDTILRQKLNKTRLSTAHGFMPQELMSFGLPARRTTKKDWTRRNGDFEYTVSAGKYDGYSELPSGKYARAALLFLCTQAKLTGDPVLHVTKTYRGFVSGLGLEWNGPGAGKEAARQLGLVASANFQIDFLGKEGLAPDETRVKSQGARLSENIDFWFKSKELSTDKDSTIVLSPLFMRMMDRAVPIKLSAWHWIMRESKSPTSLDVYLWLCTRLYRCSGHQRVTWTQIYDQFGSIAPMKRFKQQFREALQVALQVYPEAQIREDFGMSRVKGFKGFHLFPSPDPRDSKTPDERLLTS